MINMKYKKVIFLGSLIVFVVIIFILGTKINKKLEFEIAKELIASTPGLTVQIGLAKSTEIQCTPSCQVMGEATCCAPVGNCPQVVPGTNGTYDTACPMYSDVRGQMSGGMLDSLLASRKALIEAGYKSGDSMIFGGTSNNMSMGGQANIKNTVLATPGGCSGCRQFSLNWKEKLEKKIHYFIAGFKSN